MTLNHLVSFFWGTFQKFVQGNAYQMILIKSYSQIRVTSKRYFYYTRDKLRFEKCYIVALYLSFFRNLGKNYESEIYRYIYIDNSFIIFNFSVSRLIRYWPYTGDDWVSVCCTATERVEHRNSG